MSVMEAFDEFMSLIIPVSTALTASASVYYVFMKVNFPEAKMFAGIIFVVTLYRAWGNTERCNHG